MAQFNSTGVGMMIAAVAIMFLIGIQYNEMTSTGFTNPLSVFDQNGTCTSINCPQFGATNNAPVNVCATPANCQISKPVFYNKNSPFALLFGQNIGSLGQNFAGQSGLFANAFSLFNQRNFSNPFFSICISVNGSTWSGASVPANTVYFTNCDQVSVNDTKVPDAINPNTGLPYTKLDEALNCTLMSAIVASINVPYRYYGCHAYLDAIFPTAAKYAILAINNTQAANGGANSDIRGQMVVVDPTIGYNGDNDPNKCNGVNLPGGNGKNPGTQCSNWENGIGQTNGQTNSQFFGLALGFGFIAGIIFLLLGLGLGIGAGGLTFNFSLTANSQGTRLCQAVGFGLLVWIPVLSFEGNWITSTVLGPWGFEVIALFALSGTFFAGMFQQITAGTAGS